ncbi:MAG: hypothetical protein IPG22_06805 [Acidobacteria bacterium]|nr:hypothetical protein [Acidobacteriota bacterium]
MGNFIGQVLSDRVGENGSVWDEWDQTLNDPESFLPKELSRHIDSTIARSWQVMSAERRSFLELLSRIDLSLGQANIITTPETRKEYGIEGALRHRRSTLIRVDRGIFPDRLRAREISHTRTSPCEDRS